MSMSKGSKMLQFINYRMRVTITDSRTLVGKFMAFDKHMNLILGDCEEYRKISAKGKGKEEREEKRTLGFVLIRGEFVVSLTVEGPPPLSETRISQIPTVPGPGLARPVGRGIVMPAAMNAPPPGLSGVPAPGVGPGMIPQGRVSAPPMSYMGAPPMGRGMMPMGRGMMPMGRGMMPMGRGMMPMPGMGRGIPPGMPGMPGMNNMNNNG
eukprot:TRINITY_DN583_c0_g1_i1.p1 TRINITY_DN583_c0_g1~~TRINITY_DN583_c0_g1_i1.p1  ORF type:complete len:209 (-),score=19.81 TRINITY_DN583_c0_g1_i1:105-731(-)